MNLAIKGHYARGKEVIKILEMLGGINLRKLEGTDPAYYYIIDNDGTIFGINVCLNNKYVLLTLEEFLVKFPYKVGDKVIAYCEGILAQFTIQDMRWNPELHKVEYKICSYWLDASAIQPFKEETMDGKYNVEKYLKVWGETEKGLEVFVNNNFELKEDNGKFYIIKKQPQYPKTYGECCEVLMGKTDFQDFELVLTKLSITQAQNDINIFSPVPPHITLINNFYKLLICRDAYWLLAGKQMGLGEPWEPDSKNKVYYIFYCISSNLIKWSEGNLYSNTILSFPTKEMRDAFFENFKDLIEQCKELL